MRWIFIAIAGVFVAIKSHCIVLPTTTTAATDKPYLEPSLDALIREIFVANNTDMEASIDEKPRVMKVCEGKCVPMETSCDFVDSENDSESGDPDEYSNGDGEFFDIRVSLMEPENRQCQDDQEHCCDHASNEIMHLSTRPEIVFGPAKFNRCGQRSLDNTMDRVISDGAASHAEFPWMVAILKLNTQKPNEFVYKCGGSLIHPSVVLTVAHCVHRIPASRLRVRAGQQNFNEVFQGQERVVRHVIVHDAFNASRSSLHNDIALIILDSPMHMFRNIASVCLPPAFTSFDRKRCIVSGWGRNNRGRDRRVLKKIQLPVVPRATCERSLRSTRLGRKFRLHRSFICAGGEPGRDACSGDGGSPMVCLARSTRFNVQQFVQVGIVAVGIGCGNHVPGVYVNVPEFRPWIDNQMMEKGFAKSYYQM